MRYLNCAVFALAAGMSTGLAAQDVELASELETCVEPGLMIVPEGDKATSQEMIQAHSDVNAYIDTTKTFLACLLANEKAVGDALTYEQKKSSITRYNLAVARMERLIESYNQQLQAYKQTHDEAS